MDKDYIEQDTLYRVTKIGRDRENDRNSYVLQHKCDYGDVLSSSDIRNLGIETAIHLPEVVEARSYKNFNNIFSESTGDGLSKIVSVFSPLSEEELIEFEEGIDAAELKESRHTTPKYL